MTCLPSPSHGDSVTVPVVPIDDPPARISQSGGGKTTLNPKGKVIGQLMVICGILVFSMERHTSLVRTVHVPRIDSSSRTTPKGSCIPEFHPCLGSSVQHILGRARDSIHGPPACAANVLPLELLAHTGLSEFIASEQSEPLALD